MVWTRYSSLFLILWFLNKSAYIYNSTSQTKYFSFFISLICILSCCSPPSRQHYSCRTLLEHLLNSLEKRKSRHFLHDYFHNWTLELQSWTGISVLQNRNLLHLVHTNFDDLWFSNTIHSQYNNYQELNKNQKGDFHHICIVIGCTAQK